jgi:hypothetical protein
MFLLVGEIPTPLWRSSFQSLVQAERRRWTFRCYTGTSPVVKAGCVLPDICPLTGDLAGAIVKLAIAEGESV